MKNIKKFAKRLVVFFFVGMGIVVFIAGVVGPVFDLSKPIIIAVSAGLMGVFTYLWWTFVEFRKKK